MFRNYIQYQELYHFFPRLQSWTDKAEVNTILNSSAQVVANDLRRKGIDTSKVYVPLMHDSLAVGAVQTQTDYTSSGLAIDNQRRFVLEVKSTTGCTFTASGSRDNAYYSPLEGLDDTNFTISLANGESGLYSMSFVEGYNYIKYQLVGIATYSVYAVDTSFDMLIIYKAIQQITMPLLGTDSVATEMYTASIEMYNNLLMSQVYDYDVDDDGVIDTNEQSLERRWRVMR